MSAQRGLEPCYEVTVWGTESPVGSYIECGVSLRDLFTTDHDVKEMAYSAAGGAYDGDAVTIAVGAATAPAPVGGGVAQQTPSELPGLVSLATSFATGVALGAVLCAILDTIYPRRQAKKGE